MNKTWKQDRIVVAGGKIDGNQLDQRYWLSGIDIVDDHQCIYAADWKNHRNC